MNWVFDFTWWWWQEERFKLVLRKVCRKFNQKFGNAKSTYEKIDGVTGQLPQIMMYFPIFDQIGLRPSAPTPSVMQDLSPICSIWMATPKLFVICETKVVVFLSLKGYTFANTTRYNIQPYSDEIRINIWIFTPKIKVNNIFWYFVTWDYCT